MPLGRGLKALERLVKGAYTAPHEYRTSLQVFPDLSVDILAKELNVIDKGAANGRADHPSPESASFDEVETAIIERIYSERKGGHQSLIDQLDTCVRRLGALDFEGRFATIRQTAPEVVAEFKAEAKQGRDDLFRLRRSLLENERERDDFRTAHALTRAPQVASSVSIAWKIAVLCFLFISETYINGVFLAKGNELGLIGGVAEALVFSILNVWVSFSLGLIGIRQLNHFGLFRRGIGLLTLLAWLAFVLTLNLALAHYREISGVLYDDAGARVIARLKSQPFGLVDIKSWLFFAIGLVWASVALAEGILFTDPYPGYAKLEMRVKAAHETYTDRKTALIEDLRAIRDQASDDMKEAQRDLSKRREEHDAILQTRSRLLQLFEQFQDQLERIGKALLELYRAANRKVRTKPAPARFEQPWQFDRLVVGSELPEVIARTNLKEEIKAAQAVLGEQITAIHQAFTDAVESYRQIDDLLIGEQHEPVQLTAKPAQVV